MVEEKKLPQSPKSFIDQTVFPGDVVLDLSTMANQTIKLGDGLRQYGDTISVMKTGKLRFLKPNKYWVESLQKRYVPHVEDMVLGIVVDCKAENFLVDIKGPALANLHVLAFEGGTRRNIPKFEARIQALQSQQGQKSSEKTGYGFSSTKRGILIGCFFRSDGVEHEQLICSCPELVCRSFYSYYDTFYRWCIFLMVGTLLYSRVVKANTGMNPELSCTNASGKAAEFGSLKDGYSFESSTGLSRMLLSSPTCPVLEALGKKLSFEIAVGLNGRVWVNAESPSTVILVANAIMTSESLSGVQQRMMVDKLIQRLQ